MVDPVVEKGVIVDTTEVVDPVVDAVVDSD